jgi:hypothetical protein
VSEKTLKEQLAETAVDVVIEAAKFGLEEAGARILGPTAWKGFKKIITPVISRLQKIFPTLRLEKPDAGADPAINEEAAEYLKNDPSLVNLLFENFGQLKEGQDEILSGISRLTRVAEKTAQDVSSVLQLSQEILGEIKHTSTAAHAYELPEWVDVSDTLEQQLTIARLKARRRNEELNLPVVGVIFYSMGVGLFAQQVLQEGRPNKLYKTKIMGAVVTMRVGAEYRNQDNLICRKGTIDQPRWGEPKKHLVSQSVFYQSEGYWKTLELKEQREY